MDQPEPDVDWALSLVDIALAQTRERSLMTMGEYVNVLLDIRNALDPQTGRP